MEDKQFWTTEFNKIYRNSIKEHNKRLEDWIAETMTKASDGYAAGNPIMDDNTFDMFERWLKLHNKKHPILKQVGTGRGKDENC